MGKITGGVFGRMSGKVGGLVGGSWKGVNYLRQYVIPGLSQTDAQVAQRIRFSYVVAAGRPFVGRVFNPYYDKFLPRESGFNRFIRNNIPKAPAYTPILNFQITDGPLYPGSALTAVYTTGTGVMAIAHGVELGIDGADDDVAIYAVRHRPTNVVVFGTDGTRDAGTVNVTCAAGLTATDFDVSVFFARMNGTLVERLSRNLSATATAA